jgi:hypothetical protein
MQKASLFCSRSGIRSGIATLGLSALLLIACGGGGQGTYFWGEGDEGITLELKGDGVAMVTLTGMPPTVGTYTIEDETVTLMMNGDIDIYKIVDGNLTATGFGEEIVFVKQ